MLLLLPAFLVEQQKIVPMEDQISISSEDYITLSRSLLEDEIPTEAFSLLEFIQKKFVPEGEYVSDIELWNHLKERLLASSPPSARGISITAHLALLHARIRFDVPFAPLSPWNNETVSETTYNKVQPPYQDQSKRKGKRYKKRKQPAEEADSESSNTDMAPKKDDSDHNPFGGDSSFVAV